MAATAQIPPDLLGRCWFLAGPTACGKTAVGLELAERLEGGAEIIALDSMSLYRGMDIGTAKPSPAERARVPHHLLDVLEPHEEFSVAEYVSAAGRVCREIVSRGRTPLFVGGTGLYLRGVLRGVFSGPAADWELRRRLEAEALKHAPGWLHEQLQQVDPGAAAVLHAHDARRLIRALEVFHLTGRPLSQQQSQPPLPEADRSRHVYWLEPPRAWLYERINRRVDAMLAAGLIDEVRALLASPEPPGRTARQALGYREIMDALEGHSTLEAAVDLIRRRTRQFAKRQHTWFRNLVECRPVPISGGETPAVLSERILTIAAGLEEGTAMIE